MLKSKSMRFYIVDYRLFDGEDEYVEYSLLASRTSETAMKRAEKGKRFFNRYGWVESCRLKRLQEIPKGEFDILKKYMIHM
jgi:hypothetical protein